MSAPASALTVVVTCRVRCWVRPCLHAVAFVATVFGVAPDFDRVGAFIGRHGLSFSTRAA